MPMTAREHIILDALAEVDKKQITLREQLETLAGAVHRLGKIVTLLAARVDGLETTFAEVAAWAQHRDDGCGR